MQEREKFLIYRSYQHILNGTATEEEKLLWKLANAIHNARQSIRDTANMLKENDYTIS